MENKYQQERQKMIDLLIQNLDENKSLLKPNVYRHFKRPINGITNKPYTGINHLKLLLVATEEELKDPRWLTFKQAKAAGYHVKNGAKGQFLERYIWTETRDKLDENNQPILDENGKVMQEEIALDQPIIKEFVVFNGSQIEGLPPLEQESVSHDENIQLAEKFISSSLSQIQEEPRYKPYYDSVNDHIVVPQKNLFTTHDEFLATVIHEMGYATGSKRNNAKNATVNVPEEELKAEIASIFTKSSLGLQLENSAILEQNLAHIPYWTTYLKNNPDSFLKLCIEAGKISESLLKEYEKVNEKSQQEKSSEIQYIIRKNDCNLNLELEDYTGSPLTPELLNHLLKVDISVQELNKVLQSNENLTEINGHHGGTYTLILEQQKNGQILDHFFLELGDNGFTHEQLLTAARELNYENKSNDRKIVISWHLECLEYDYKGLWNKEVTPELLNFCQKKDEDIHAMNLFREEFNQKGYGCFETHFVLYENGEKIADEQIDIGKGKEANGTLFSKLERFLSGKSLEQETLLSSPSKRTVEEELARSPYTYYALQNNHELLLVPTYHSANQEELRKRKTPMIARINDVDYPVYQFSNFADRAFFDHFKQGILPFRLNEKLKTTSAFKPFTDFWLVQNQNSAESTTETRTLTMFHLQEIYHKNEQYLENPSENAPTYQFFHCQNGSIIEQLPIQLGSQTSPICFNHIWATITESIYLVHPELVKSQELTTNLVKSMQEKDFENSFSLDLEKQQKQNPTQEL